MSLIDANLFHIPVNEISMTSETTSCFTWLFRTTEPTLGIAVWIIFQAARPEQNGRHFADAILSAFS